MPSGRPFEPPPAGKVTQGVPARVQIELKRGLPVKSRPFGASPGALGQSSASKSSNSESTKALNATALRCAAG